ncbi:MAG: hypothetical protein KC933_07650 [Myxococcales bacterium]|nr:hypothetical protein [Myxococcales bacterium]
MAPTRRTEIKRFMRQQERPARELAFLLHDVQDPVNVGSAFRIADAAKAQVILTGITALPDHKLVQKVGRGKHKRVPWRTFETVEAAAAALVAWDEEGYAVGLAVGEAVYAPGEVSLDGLLDALAAVVPGPAPNPGRGRRPGLWLVPAGARAPITGVVALGVGRQGELTGGPTA